MTKVDKIVVTTSAVFVFAVSLCLTVTMTAAYNYKQAVKAGVAIRYVIDPVSISPMVGFRYLTLEEQVERALEKE